MIWIVLSIIIVFDIVLVWVLYWRFYRIERSFRSIHAQRATPYEFDEANSAPLNLFERRVCGNFRECENWEIYENKYIGMYIGNPHNPFKAHDGRWLIKVCSVIAVSEEKFLVYDGNEEYAGVPIEMNKEQYQENLRSENRPCKKCGNVKTKMAIDGDL